MLFLTLANGDFDVHSEYSGIDKVAHFIMFIPFTFLMIVGFRKQTVYRLTRLYAVKKAIVIGISFGLLIEVIQFFLPYRGIEFVDIVADVCGVFMGYTFYWLIYKMNLKWL